VPDHVLLEGDAGGDQLVDLGGVDGVEVDEFWGAHEELVGVGLERLAEDGVRGEVG
jgi:hypothetical protein